MGASKEAFLEQRTMEEFDNMPTFNEVMRIDSQDPLEMVNQIRKLRESIESINEKINTLKVKASNNIYAFKNSFNAPYSVCIEMINSPSTPYFYISPTVRSEYIKRPGYHGEEYRGKICVRNPVFDWEGEEGAKLKYKEKKFYENE